MAKCWPLVTRKVLSPFGDVGDNASTFGRGLYKPLSGHAGPVVSASFSPDGRWLATGSRDTSIILWDMSTDEPISQTLSGHTDGILDMSFSPDGRILASAGDNTIRLWDVASGRSLFSPLAAGIAEAVKFNPGGEGIASGGTSVILWDFHSVAGDTASEGDSAGDQSPKQRFSWNMSACACSGLVLAYRPDGQILAQSRDAKISLRDGVTGEQIGQTLIGPAPNLGLSL